jgi:hypothetical protein
MKFIITTIKKFLPKDISKPLGRWRIENCNKQTNNKIDLSNEDHCGPCGQYALEKVKLKNNTNTVIQVSKKV